jgi:hypothetical protein
VSTFPANCRDQGYRQSRLPSIMQIRQQQPYRKASTLSAAMPKPVIRTSQRSDRWQVAATGIGVEKPSACSRAVQLGGLDAPPTDVRAGVSFRRYCNETRLDDRSRPLGGDAAGVCPRPGAICISAANDQRYIFLRWAI